MSNRDGFGRPGRRVEEARAEAQAESFRKMLLAMELILMPILQAMMDASAADDRMVA